MLKSLEVCSDRVAEEASRGIRGDRGGLLAFDVGVGKTWTALAIVLGAGSRDRETRRSVIVVPPEMAVRRR